MRPEPKYEGGQMVLHKLDRRCMMITEILGIITHVQRYECKYITSDNSYKTGVFKEYELEEDKNVV